jgi:hypothetical protein
LRAIDLSSTWALDLKASDSTEALLKQSGVPALQRKLAASIKLGATYRQSKDHLTVQTRGPGFSRVQRFDLNGQPEAKTEKLTGPYTVRTAWSHDGKQLISTSAFRTKDGKGAALRVARQLVDGGNTLVLSGTLKVEGEPPRPADRRVWRRQMPSG